MTTILKNVLILDDDLQVLSALKRALRKHFNVTAFDNAQAALSALQQDFYPVIISDMRMPVMNGATFLQKSYQVSPNSQRILLTGYADIDSTIQAVNHGHIQCYLQKPWNNKELLEHVSIAAKAAEQNLRLAQISKNVLQLDSAEDKSRSLYKNVIDFIGQIAAVNQTNLMEHHHRIAQHIHAIGHQLNWPKQQILHCYLASLFYSLGLVIAQIHLDKAFYALNAKQQQAYVDAIEQGAKLISIFEHLRPVANLISRLANTNHKSADKITPISLLTAVIDYDLLVQGWLLPQKVAHNKAIDWLLTNNKKRYATQAVKYYAAWLEGELTSEHSEANLLLQPQALKAVLAKSNKQSSFVLEAAVVTEGGSVLLTQGQILDDAKVNHLAEVATRQNVQLLLSVKKIALCPVNLAS